MSTFDRSFLRRVAADFVRAEIWMFDDREALEARNRPLMGVLNCSLESHRRSRKRLKKRPRQRNPTFSVAASILLWNGMKDHEVHSLSCGLPDAHFI